MKCDQCNRPATVHLTEIRGGKKLEKNLCEQCAAKLGSAQGTGHTPINELLSKFVMEHSGRRPSNQRPVSSAGSPGLSSGRAGCWGVRPTMTCSNGI